MVFEGFEQDFNTWELQSQKECKAIIEFFDKSYKKDIIQLAVLFRTDASGFVSMLRNITERIFVEVIGPLEELSNVLKVKS